MAFCSVYTLCSLLFFSTYSQMCRGYPPRDPHPGTHECTAGIGLRVHGLRFQGDSGRFQDSKGIVMQGAGKHARTASPQTVLHKTLKLELRGRVTTRSLHAECVL